MIIPVSSASEIETPARPDVDIAIGQEHAFEPLWHVIIHNDDVTPFEYVIAVLISLFMLSEEMAEHVATTAHVEGQAVVVVRPRPEAERLIKVAQTRARLDGYPLKFSMEPEAT